jgi:hypothetical protein
MLLTDVTGMIANVPPSRAEAAAPRIAVLMTQPL